MQKKSQFADFKFEDKVIDNNEKARVSVMVHWSISHERLNVYKDNKKTPVIIKVKDGKERWIIIFSINE